MKRRADNVSLRLLLEGDLPFAMEVKEAAGWNQTLEDWRDLLAWRPAGCFLAELDGAPAGTVTTTVHGGRIGWIGMLLVHPRARRRGVGTALLEGAIESLCDVPEVLLDATPAGRKVYEPRGFVAEAELVRMARPVNAERSGGDLTAPGLEVRALQPGDLDAVSALDAHAFGASRRPLLEAWLRRAPGLARVAEGPRGLEGFILGRPGARGPYLGPMVASSPAVAAALLATTLESLHEGPAILDTFVDDPGWLEILGALGFEAERSLTRMRHVPGAALPRDGAASQERDRQPGRLASSAPAAGASRRPHLIAGPEVG